jgi:hypothetical protein
MLTAIYAECHIQALYTEGCYAECHFAECYYAECHYGECHYAESHYADFHYMSVVVPLKPALPKKCHKLLVMFLNLVFGFIYLILIIFYTCTL